MTTTIIKREASPKPPAFKRGTHVAFRAFDGEVYEGIYQRRYSPSRRAGYHYELLVNGNLYSIFANGPVGRTLTVQQP